MTHQANVKNIVSQLHFKLRNVPRKLKNSEGPAGRIKKLQKTVTALIKYERIELHYERADEARGYIERLISEARRYGPNHQEMMEMADFWILEKQLVHKLFKVLVPRYQNYEDSFTKLYRTPVFYPESYRPRALLELKGNIYPSLEYRNPRAHNMIHNILLSAARKDHQLSIHKDNTKNKLTL